MPTLLGGAFFCLGLYCFFVREEWLLGLLLVAGVFQAGSVLDVGGRGLQPYYLVAILIVLRALLNTVMGAGPRLKLRDSTWLLTFGAIAVLSACVLPILFAGTPVYDPEIGIDDGLLLRPPLKLDFYNFVQAGFVLLHIAAAFASLRLRFSSLSTQRAYRCAFYLAVFIIVLQALAPWTGVSLPDTLIRNNPAYAISEGTEGVGGTRHPGSFTEASAAGAFLVIYCVGFLAEYLEGSGGLLLLALALVATGLVGSSGSLLALSVVGMALLVRYSPLRLRLPNRGRTARRYAFLLLAVGVPAALAVILSPGYRQTLLDLTVSKGDSGSFIARTSSDLYSLGLVVRTFGLGVGLGSNRASSLATTLVSNVGVPGFLAFCIFYFRLFAHVAKQNTWLRWAGLGMLLNMCLGIADVTMVIFWIPIMLAVQSAAGRTIVAKAVQPLRVSAAATPPLSRFKTIH